MRKQSVLKNARDFIVIEKTGRDSHIYAVKPSLDVMRQFYEQSISNPEDRDVDVFNRHWKFDAKEGIRGSSTFLALRFDKQALRPNGLWIPGMLEAKALESQGKLQNGVYRDYGIVVYNDDNPNKQVAETLVPQAKELGLELPLIVPFMALDYVPNKHRKYGIEPSLLNSGKGIISGKKAQDNINSLNYKANSGVLRLLRDRGGDWNANWYDLDDSGDDGRVDWICGEATSKILEKAYSELSERKYGERIRELREEQKSESAKFKDSLKR